LFIVPNSILLQIGEKREYYNYSFSKIIMKRMLIFSLFSLIQFINTTHYRGGSFTWKPVRYSFLFEL